MQIFLGILIPFLGTTLGSAGVFFMRKSLGVSVQRALAGFAAGVMVAASIWSLLIPAIEQSENLGKLSFFPALIGFWVGVLFLLMLDRLIPHLHVGSEQAEGPKSKLERTTMMVLAVTLHNFPEGMVTFLSGMQDISVGLPIAFAIAIHNIPEGISVSVPIYYATGNRHRAFAISFLSGLAEPAGAIVGYLLLAPFLNQTVYGVIFAMIAGIMVYISLDELLPAAEVYGKHHQAIYGLIGGMFVMAASLLLL